MQHCSEIPTYTPIATFIGGRYYPSLAESGVFMGCIQGGFKVKLLIMHFALRMTMAIFLPGLRLNADTDLKLLSV